MSNYRFVVRKGALEKVDVASDAVVACHAPVGTRIVQLLPKGARLVIREDYYRFPERTSNVYSLNHDLQRVWTAELPSPTDTYANPVIDQGNVLACASWEGFDCLLDPETGKILRKTLSK